MAELIYAFATSHGPQLSLPPALWDLRTQADRKRNENTFKDGVFSFEELLELRRAEREYFIAQCQPEVYAAHYARSQAALEVLADTFARLKPDVLIIIGDDQHEWFQSTNQPALSILHGKEVLNRQYDPAEYANGIEIAAQGWRPPQDQYYPIQSDLAEHLIRHAMADEFDVATCADSPRDAKGPLGITHSIGFIARRIMRDRPVPIVPVLLNTFWPPNQIKPGRCYDFGRSLSAAVRTWGGAGAGQRVALCASGGLSHYVIDEPWDRKMLAAMQQGDVATLRNEPNAMFQGGTSETKNWITLCGAMAAQGLPMKLIDYVPCYRSEAGTGNAMAFATWEP